MNFPDSNLENAHGYKIVLLNFAPKYFSGIKISKNPGNVFIWFGFDFMTIGILLLYFFPQKNIWIFVEATDTSVSRVKVYGSSSRPESDFQNKFRDIGEILQRHPQKGP
jgi:cytochrome c biogenesis protein